MDYFSKVYRDARFLFLAMREFGPNEIIEIGNEISDESLKKYDEKLHTIEFVPPMPSNVTEISGDGH